MNSRFEKDDIVEVNPGVHLPFKVPRRRGVVRLAYDHNPPAYDVEFYWEGRSLGTHYFTDDELEPFRFKSWALIDPATHFRSSTVIT